VLTTELTLFLRIPGAPLDSNIVERVLKKAILHRKAALFYKTLNGARVGDVFMSLIYTAELNDVPPFEYLIALLPHIPWRTADPTDINAIAEMHFP
jgi:transposase